MGVTAAHTCLYITTTIYLLTLRGLLYSRGSNRIPAKKVINPIRPKKPQLI